MVILVIGAYIGAADHHLLRHEDFLDGDLHAEVAARDHDAVRGTHDLIVVVQPCGGAWRGDEWTIRVAAGSDVCVCGCFICYVL